AAADVDEGDLGERRLLGLEDRGEEVDATVGDLDVTEGDLSIGPPARRQRGEDGRLARARVTTDSDAHGPPLVHTGPARNREIGEASRLREAHGHGLDPAAPVRPQAAPRAGELHVGEPPEQFLERPPPPPAWPGPAFGRCSRLPPRGSRPPRAG